MKKFNISIFCVSSVVFFVTSLSAQTNDSTGGEAPPQISRFDLPTGEGVSAAKYLSMKYYKLECGPKGTTTCSFDVPLNLDLDKAENDTLPVSMAEVFSGKITETRPALRIKVENEYRIYPTEVKDYQAKGKEQQALIDKALQEAGPIAKTIKEIQIVVVDKATAKEPEKQKNEIELNIDGRLLVVMTKDKSGYSLNSEEDLRKYLQDFNSKHFLKELYAKQFAIAKMKLEYKKLILRGTDPKSIVGGGSEAAFIQFHLDEHEDRRFRKANGVKDDFFDIEE